MENNRLHFFGLYLKDKGVITQEALDDALAFQEESNRRIGELAKERGYLSQEQVDAIFEEQKRIDRPFGVIALRHKFLTRHQLDDLLFTQTVFSTHLGEALLIKGYLSPEQFSEELEAFRKEQVRHEQKLAATFSGLADKDVYLAIVSSVNKTFARFGGREFKVAAICAASGTLFEFCYSIVVDTAEKGRVQSKLLFAESLLPLILGKSFQGHSTHTGGNALPPSQEFFEIVGRYFSAALTEQGLTVLRTHTGGGRADTPCAVVMDCGLVVQLSIPSGQMILQISIEKSEDKEPCIE